MTEASRKRFLSLADDLKRKTEAEQRVRADCVSIMDGIVRPALREARQAIQSNRIEWGEGAAPSIRVKSEYHYELCYECRGPILYVKKHTGGMNDSHEVPLEQVSEEAIVREIDLFLREALGLKT